MIRHGSPAKRSFRGSRSADDDVISLYLRRGFRKIQIQMIDDKLALRVPCAVRQFVKLSGVVFFR